MDYLKRQANVLDRKTQTIIGYFLLLHIDCTTSKNNRRTLWDWCSSGRKVEFWVKKVLNEAASTPHGP